MGEEKTISIIGAGIVGLAVALKLKTSHPSLKIRILEKENQPGSHQSTHNSGVLHAGLYYAPNSFKARLCKSGIEQMVAFCETHAIPYERCGKIVVASNQNQLLSLENLLQRGLANGLKNLKILNADEMKELEPNVKGIKALHVPEEGIVDYRLVVNKLRELLANRGVIFDFNFEVTKILKTGNEVRIESNKNEAVVSSFFINCAGLFSDKIAKLSGLNPKIRIIPFRGEYFLLNNRASKLICNLIYPVPNPNFPFLGVHFTRLIGGGIEAGPNAIIALGREAYSWRDSSLKSSLEIFSFPGLWKFIAKHPKECSGELLQSISKRKFCANLQKLVPSIGIEDLVPGHSGVRAQAMFPNGTLCNDFVFNEEERGLHVLNAPSPAATASLAIADEIALRFKALLN